MKTYIKPKLIILFLFSTLTILAASPDDAVPASTVPAHTGSAVSYTGKADLPVREIPLPASENIEEFIYNPAGSSLCAITHSRHTYRLLVLEPDGQWTASSRWTTSSGEELLHFVYNGDGALYACRRTIRKSSGQALVRLRKNGRISKITLRDLNQVPKTFFDTRMKKKGQKVSHDITDIQFSGTALAVTYGNYAVRFYNIAEGHALGSAALTGSARQNIFYDHHYLALDKKSSSASPRLKNYDIRTGELEQTIPLPALPQGEIRLSHYRERVWLLCGNTLCAGTFPEMSLSQEQVLPSSVLPAGSRIHSINAARDDVLYLSYRDSTMTLHLLTFSFRLDSLPSL